MIMHNFIGKYTNPSRKIKFMPEAVLDHGNWSKLVSEQANLNQQQKLFKAGFCKPANKSTS